MNDILKRAKDTRSPHTHIRKTHTNYELTYMAKYYTVVREKMYKISCLFFVLFALLCETGHASVASAGYVDNRVEDHAINTSNPHNVTAAQVGLSDVKNVDTTNADNITSGTISYDRMPVGSTVNTIAAGDDTRFYTIPTSRPSVTAPSDAVLVWFE